MMRILIIVLKFESTYNLNRIRWRHHLEDDENVKLPISLQDSKINCQYLCKTVRYEAEIWYAEVIYDTDFDYGIQISVN